MRAVATPAEVTCTAQEIEPPGDLLDLATADSFVSLHGDDGVVANGTACRVPAGSAHAALASIEVVGTGGSDAPDSARPIACGALPFEDDATTTLRVPAWQVVVRGGRAFSLRVGARTAPPPDGAPPQPLSPRPPARFVVTAVDGFADWQDRVRRALLAIEAGTVAKVVLARRVRVETDTPIDRNTVLRRLREAQPGCFVYGDAGFVGATPELLVRRRGSEVESRPMAGSSAPGAGTPALLGSEKDRHEHVLVVNAVAAALAGLCDDVSSEAVPHVATFPSVSHLTSRVRARCGPDVTAMDLAAALHPTPAVGGVPRHAADRLRRGLEPFERGRYAGPTGWVDAAGDGQFCVALRCAEIAGQAATLYAGAGIVAGSDPEAEWAETQAKLDAVLRVLVRP